MNIYLITTFEKMPNKKDEYGYLQIGCKRSVGYYTDFESARIRIEFNMCDLWETVYNYAVIEELEEGLYPISENKWFYKYNEKINKYEIINCISKDYEFYNIGEIC